MIKGNVTLCGKISHATTLGPNQEDEIYTFLLVKLNLSNKAGNIKECLVSVCMKRNSPESSIQYSTGTPVEITGQLTCRKHEKKLYIDLAADSITFSAKNQADSIRGEVEFYNYAGKVPAIKADTHGYLYVSSFNDEQPDKECISTWIRFIHFSDEEEKCSKRNSDIPQKGVMDILFYNSNMNLGYLFKETSKRKRTIKTE